MATTHEASPKALTAARRREAAKRDPSKMTGRGSGLTPRIRQAIELLVFGGEEGSVFRIEDAAAKAGLGARALRAAMVKPAVEAFYRSQMHALRNAEKATGFRRIVEIRDDPKLKDSPAGQRVALDAAKATAFDPPGAGGVNVQINNSLALETPGYVIKLNRRHGADEHDAEGIAIEGQARREG